MRSIKHVNCKFVSMRTEPKYVFSVNKPKYVITVDVLYIKFVNTNSHITLQEIL